VPTYSVDDERDIAATLAGFGVQSLPYRVVSSAELPDDHSSLDALVEAVAQDVGVDLSTGLVDTFTERMLKSEY